jgi:cell division septation protein DedD
MATASEDTEITLGTGKMLALFFGLVALCAVFFAMGFSLGKKTGNSGSGDIQTTTPSSAVRPQAAKSSGNSRPDMTFYKAVGQTDANTQLSPAAGDPQAPADSAAATSAQPDDKPKQTDPMTPPAINGYYVQVAAVSKQEDAEALIDALKKKQYPAFGASVAGDKLFHVQVGPFTDIKEAEGMRAKLVSDGYNPILKR